VHGVVILGFQMKIKQKPEDQNSVFELVFDIGVSKSDSLGAGSAPQRASPPPPRRWPATALLGGGKASAEQGLLQAGGDFSDRGVAGDDAGEGFVLEG